MFCGNCGARVEDGAIFCEDCGNKLGEAAPASQPPASQPLCPPQAISMEQYSRPPCF
ncbi:MAG: zinc-ribbon domain-containing protein [Deferribacteraceae bacterium]|nr:zinc-ribbon domain-containing protein [Deferribacteraceae bacterium]